jgi:hypothetical protein
MGADDAATRTRGTGLTMEWGEAIVEKSVDTVRTGRRAINQERQVAEGSGRVRSARDRGHDWAIRSP